MSSMVTPDSLDLQRGVENEPLTEQELRLLFRLLSDPSVFPRDFKRWVTDHASDSVDIAKSQVHGLLTGSGQVYVPPPERVSELPGGFMNISGYISGPSGSGFAIATLPTVECDGKAVILSFFVPYVYCEEGLIYLTIDTAQVGNLAKIRQGSGGGMHLPLRLEYEFSPAKGTHSFSVQMRPLVGSGTVIAGTTFGADYFLPGFLRISRA